VREALDRLTRAEERVPWLPTGLATLDSKMQGGFRPGELIVLAARPRVGKSALAMQIARNVAERRGVLVFSLEMTRPELTDRMLANEARVEHRHLREMKVPKASMEAIVKAASAIYSLPLHIDDTPSLPIGEIRSRARRHARRHDLGLIVVDYLQFVVAPKCDSREQAVATIARGLKSLAKELGVPVLALAQLNRAGKDAPSLEHLRESGEIEATANTVMLLHREELVSKSTQRKGIADVIFAKQRSGASGVSVELKFTGTCVRFDDMEQEYGHESGEFEAASGGEDWAR
jgi:replicative DNA helicase